MSPHKRVADVFWVQTTVPAAFLKPQCKYNENSRISNPLHRATEALPSDHQPERVICTVTTCRKANIKKNLVEFYQCLPNNEYTKLKWYASELVSVCQSTYEYADTVQDDICKTSVQISTETEHFSLVVMIRNTNCELQLQKMLSNPPPEKTFHSY